ncbi:TIGR03087 family PEP-CTERM/XrtA system glycosyltransferase [Alteromonas gilva]|uniref:TIGR03087 family PEP-CTERM/XrtA system glycosyltransferase n=1 Tax=Alteromonas gilva TaxID=2987522 RepID=A0ABT5L0B0_9ALTE|nr:TIGR03087 family PEP-CTERM/XrtA system glycosyltransferase [Alteromonas gilva]MDC8830327.1 TIGR03087 family PEP-CTERM/XrtA system glycosyltransferase [Alteromonas gilva]
METVLFLCHRIPFPPNKGDKITTYNLVKYLAKRYRLVIGCFIDDEHDKQYIPTVEQMCDELFTVDITAKSNLRSGVMSLFANKPVSTYHYNSAAMQQWVDDVTERRGIKHLIAYSAGTAQFIEGAKHRDKKRIVDMADVDSDKWQQYAAKKPFYSAWVYAREHRLVKQYEQQILRDFDAVTLITDEERDLFKSLSPASFANKIVTLGNGVDTEYFDPQAQFDFTDKPDDGHELICFTGAMDYWANEDAVVWFVSEVWPAVRQRFPDLYFYIVGGKPTEKVQSLADQDGVVVTGRVVDVRPYVHKSKLCVAPLRIARGVQNKVLEAMSMAKPVVMTSMGQEGIELPDAQQPLVEDNPQQQAALLISLLDDRAKLADIGQINREWIAARYGWDGALSLLDSLLEQDAPYDS